MAGRVLSGANEAKLRAALEALNAVLGSLGEPDAGTPAQEAEQAPLFDGEPVVEAALEGDIMPLVEASAVDKSGTAMLKIIQAGWGSSGYYPVDVLKRDGPAIFKAGTKSYWDHQTAAEEAERPEGTLTKLAGEFVNDAQWQDSGPAGPGLYAETKIFGPYREAVNELAPHIGVSIRASGRTRQGEAEGRKGPIIEQLVAARSVDFVTVPGAGGKIVQMFEAARPASQAAPIQVKEESNMEVQEQLAEAQARILTLQQDAARLRETLLLRDARDQVSVALAAVQVPDVTRARLQEQLSANPPANDAGALDAATLATRITEAVTAEQQYLAQATGSGSGRIVGMGGNGAAADKPADLSAKMVEAFRAFGLSEQEAKIAAGAK